MFEKYSLDLLERLCLTFGPSGCEDPVARVILESIEDCCDELIPNRTLGVIAVIRGNGKSEKRLMISSHMDEVGFMIKSVSEDGTLKVASMCGGDTRIMAGRRVLISRDGKAPVRGVFAVKPIHLQKADERDKALPADELYIDIGAADKEEALKHVSVGDYCTFESDFVRFGEGGRMIKGKAIDDRAGCSAMCTMMRELYPVRESIPFDMYFAFTCREELGISGARGAAHLIDPTHALIIESTAVGDICGSAPHKTVARQGEGAVISFMDRATIYDKELCDLIFDVAKSENIPCQVKQYVSGGNDGGHIHKSRAGVKCAVMSLASRYIHTPSNVIRCDDYLNTCRLALATVKRMAEN